MLFSLYGLDAQEVSAHRITQRAVSVREFRQAMTEAHNRHAPMSWMLE
jgi:hypothetical protein